MSHDSAPTRSALVSTVNVSPMRWIRFLVDGEELELTSRGAIVARLRSVR
jgi:antitoxin (DNA-binding transcriptional repressor) of toxin-antitoxin stability system